MTLRESPYPSRCLAALSTVACSLMYPSYWLLDQLLSLKETTAERRKHRHQRGPPYALQVLVMAPVWGLLLLLSAPLALLGLLLWLPLQTARRPFAYQHTPSLAPPREWLLPGNGKAFGFLSANLCLLPSGIAKFSNLGQTRRRAVHIAQGIVQGVSRAGPVGEGSSNSLSPFATGQGYGAIEHSPPRAALRSPEEEEPGPGEITASFPPDVDVVCLQEVFDPEASACVRRRLGACYGHILYDVGIYGFVGCSAFKVFNSGLLLASRYPVLAVKYHCYPCSRGEDTFSAKGLLSVQIHLGTAGQGERIVGYVNCTHLHAPEVDAQVRCDQLTLGLFWIQLFRDAHSQPNDVVAFDILCGDLNFDNCSSGDHLEQVHEIFRLYADPCRVGPGQDKPWAIGTLMNYLEIYDDPVATPEKLKRTLEQKEGRQKYLAGPILSDGRPDPSARELSSDGRRIDYILYREHPNTVGLNTAVEKFSFITGLASCSDHIAVGLRLSVSPDGE